MILDKSSYQDFPEEERQKIKDLLFYFFGKI
jgi:hypothetical protein